MSTTYFSEIGNLRRRGLDEVDLQEALEVQVGDLLAVLRAEELAELGVRDDAALEVGVKAAVLADIGGHKLRYIRLGALGLRGETHEGGQLVRDGAELEKGVVRAASLVGRALLGGHRRGVLAHTALGVTGLTLQGLGGIRNLAEELAGASGELGVQGANAVVDGGEEGIGGAGLGRHGRLSGDGGGNHGRGGRDGDIDDGLGGRRLLGGGGLGGGRGLLVSGHLVCINGGL